MRSSSSLGYMHRNQAKIGTDVRLQIIYILLVLLVFLVPLSFWSMEAVIDLTGRKLVARHHIAEFKWSKALVLNLFSCLLLLVSAVWFLTGLTGKRAPLKSRRTYTLTPVLLFAVTILASFFQSVNAHKSFHAVVLIGGALVVYFVAVLYVHELSVIRRIFIAASVAASAVSLFGLVQYFEVAYLPMTQYGGKNPGSLFGLTNFAAEFLIIPFPMSIALFASERKLYKFVFGTGSATIFAYLVIAENRASWLAVLVEVLLGCGIIIVFTIRREPRKLTPLNPRVLIAAGGLLLLTVAGITSTNYGRHLANRAASIVDVQHSTNKTRLVTWDAALTVFRDHPVLGIGLANTEILIPKYANLELETRYLESNTVIDQVHNDYLQVLIEFGVLGALAFSLLICSLIWLAVTNFKAAGDRRQLWYNIALVTGIAGLLTNIVFSFALQNPTTALYFWLSVALLEAPSLRSLEEDSKTLPATLKLFGRFAPPLLLVLAGLLAYHTYFSIQLTKAELNYSVAKAFLEVRKWREADEYLTKAIRITPHIEKYYYARALAYSGADDFGSAVPDLESCISLAPYFGRAHLALAYAHYRLGNFEKSLDEYSFAEQHMRSRREQILNALVPVYVGLKQVDRAIEAGREAVNLDSANAKYHFDLAYAYAVGGHHQKAAEECRLAINLKPDFVQAKTLLDQMVKVSGSPPPPPPPPSPP